MAYLADLLHAFCHPTPRPLVYTEPTILWSVQW